MTDDSTLSDLRELVAWLALKYGDRNPEFPAVDPVTGAVLEGNIRLARTWYREVRGGVVCPECDGATFFLHPTDDPDVGTITPCGRCDGRGCLLADSPRDPETPGTDPGATTER